MKLALKLPLKFSGERTLLSASADMYQANENLVKFPDLSPNQLQSCYNAAAHGQSLIVLEVPGDDYLPQIQLPKLHYPELWCKVLDEYSKTYCVYLCNFLDYRSPNSNLSVSERLAAKKLIEHSLVRDGQSRYQDLTTLLLKESGYCVDSLNALCRRDGFYRGFTEIERAIRFDYLRYQLDPNQQTFSLTKTISKFLPKQGTSV
jgi:hypothetical protein